MIYDGQEDFLKIFVTHSVCSVHSIHRSFQVRFPKFKDWVRTEWFSMMSMHALV